MKIKQWLFWLFCILFFFTNRLSAHPAPSSIIILDIQSNGVNAELQLPITELSLAFGDKKDLNPNTLIEQQGEQLKDYVRQHLHPLSTDKREWTVDINDMSIQTIDESAKGTVQAVVMKLRLTPPKGASSRVFTLSYDAIMHQVVNHDAFVSIRQDWEKGMIAPEEPVVVGVISIDPVTNALQPLEVNQEGGSLWTGFKSMIKLGMSHISEGTDHLMFLLVLLMAAPLIAMKKHWGTFGGKHYTFVRLFRIITAFTIGHSLTLLVGAIGWLHFPSQPIEVLIAFSILISAIHAIRPLFPQKEAYIAVGFGLIHGLAFAGTLSNLNLPPLQMGLSILGFNIGIELMQLFVMAIILPWLILLSQGAFYTPIRVGGAVFAGIVAIAWMMERVTGEANIISAFGAKLNEKAPFGIGILAFIAVVSYIFERNKKIQRIRMKQ